MVEQRVFQPADGGSIPTSPLQFYIREVEYGEARDFVQQWHYSERMPKGKNVCFGLWCMGVLYAVIVYGTGINPYQAKFLGVDSVIEIKRMCRYEPKEGYELSRFIRLTMKMVRKQVQFDAVVAFADPEYGHEGVVYKGAGFVHEGMTNAEWHVMDENGNIRHRRVAYRLSRRKGISIKQARNELDLTPIKTKPKHRWVVRLKK